MEASVPSKERQHSTSPQYTDWATRGDPQGVFCGFEPLAVELKWKFSICVSWYGLGVVYVFLPFVDVSVVE